MPEEKRGLVLGMPKTMEQRRALFNAESNIEETYVGFQFFFHKPFPLMRRGGEFSTSFCCPLYTLPIYDFDLRASHAHTLLPAALWLLRHLGLH